MCWSRVLLDTFIKFVHPTYRTLWKTFVQISRLVDYFSMFFLSSSSDWNFVSMWLYDFQHTSRIYALLLIFV